MQHSPNLACDNLYVLGVCVCSMPHGVFVPQADLADFGAFLVAHVPELAVDEQKRREAACRAVDSSFGMAGCAASYGHHSCFA